MGFSGGEQIGQGQLLIGKTHAFFDDFRRQKVASFDQSFEQRAHSG